MKIIYLTPLLAPILLLTGCAATQVALEHGKLQTNTALSHTIFLEPASAAQKSVYLSLRNTSGEPMDLESPLKQALQDKGYRITNNPKSAHYWIQANVLSVGKMSVSASQSMLTGGYGSAANGAILGAGLGALSGNRHNALGGALAGGMIGFAADALVKDVNYTLVMDLQISEARHKHQARILATANKVNLAFQTAKPVLEKSLVQTVAGLF